MVLSNDLKFFLFPVILWWIFLLQFTRWIVVRYETKKLFFLLKWLVNITSWFIILVFFYSGKNVFFIRAKMFYSWILFNDTWLWDFFVKSTSPFPFWLPVREVFLDIIVVKMQTKAVISDNIREETFPIWTIQPQDFNLPNIPIINYVVKIKFIGLSFSCLVYLQCFSLEVHENTPHLVSILVSPLYFRI